jgi:hypothetical protein
VIEFARITSADEFRDFDEPGFAKTVYDLSVREVGANRTLLSGLMRTATGPSALAQERTSWSAPCLTPRGARPKATTTGN